MSRQSLRWPNRTEAALLGLSILAFASQAAPTLAMINETRSLPRGLYLREIGAAPQPGAVVAALPPPEARAYLQGLGMPATGRLLKRVAAVGGERVCAGAGWLATPWRQAPVRTFDRRGVRLPVWRGCGLLGPDQIFLLGDTPDSFDSRNFGPVSRDAIEGVYREAVRW